MAVRYPGHLARTRSQAGFLAAGMAVVVVPLALWRAASQPLAVGIALVMLSAAPFATAFQAWRFLELQERVHQEPTPEMRFVFRFLANTPLTLGTLLLVILASIR